MNHNRLIESVKHHEGYRVEPYKDTLGKWTVGYGHLIHDEYVRTFCNPDQHEKWLDDDIAGAMRRAEDYAHNKWGGLTDAQREVLIEMAFQLGNRIFGFKNLRQGIEDDDPVKVVAEMRDSEWWKQTTTRVEDAIKKWGSE